MEEDKKKKTNEENKISEEIKKKLEECEKKTAEYLTGWQRARADFLNYKKEEMERIAELIKYAREEWILRILPIVDNFDLAEQKLPEKSKNDESIKGILQIRNQIRNLLKSEGIEEVESLGKTFDPNFHEVVEEIEDKEKEAGTIIGEVQKGYKMNGRLLRPAKVKIAKRPEIQPNNK